MERGVRPELVWGIGLDTDMERDIAEALGSGYHLRNFPMEEPPGERDMDKENPLVLWIPEQVWKELPKRTARLLRDWDCPQRVLIYGSDHAPVDFEDMTENGFLTAATAPLTAKKIRDVIFRAKEIKSLYDDIFRMTREIMLERELLARKTDLVLFLNRIMTRASESLDPATILARAREDLDILLPIRSVHAAMWRLPDDGPPEAEFFMESDMENEAEEAWMEFLMSNMRKLTDQTASDYKVVYLPILERRREVIDCTMDAKSVIVLPLRAGGRTFGCLAVSRGRGRPLGKDQVDALHAAINHLSLALHNAIAFSEVKTLADHDGLTRIHNRHAFDERMVEELRRHQRYRHSLSLLMLDLDYFKAVNDTYGHQAGDMVLREVGRLLNDVLRNTDFGARYGGEEFVVILPQTGEDQAWVLAERLRRRIGGIRFEFEGSNFQVTASIGVATLRPGSLHKRKDLLRQADEALYQAKTGGRNMVIVSGLESEGPAAQAG